jgi:hypothetical protein
VILRTTGRSIEGEQRIYSDLYDSELDTVATNLDGMHENSAFPTGQIPDKKKSVNSNPPRVGMLAQIDGGWSRLGSNQ